MNTLSTCAVTSAVSCRVYATISLRNRATLAAMLLLSACLGLAGCADTTELYLAPDTADGDASDAGDRMDGNESSVEDEYQLFEGSDASEQAEGDLADEYQLFEGSDASEQAEGDLVDEYQLFEDSDAADQAEADLTDEYQLSEGSDSRDRKDDAVADTNPNACTPDTTRCLGNTPQTCNATGEWSTHNACASPTPFCMNGSCASHDPDGCGEDNCKGGYYKSGTTCQNDLLLSKDYCICEYGYYWNGEGCGSDPCLRKCQGYKYGCSQNDVLGGYYCNCDATYGYYWNGKTCTQDRPCAANPCTGPYEIACTDYAKAPNGYACTCSQGWWDYATESCLTQ